MRLVADRVLWAGRGRVPGEEKDIRSIVIEFVSQRRDALRDYEEKRDKDLAAGVIESWIIDRFRRITIVYRKGIAGPTDDVVKQGETDQIDLLPGFVLPLAKLLAQADRGKRQQASARPPRTPNPPAGGTDG